MAKLKIAKEFYDYLERIMWHCREQWYEIDEELIDAMYITVCLTIPVKKSMIEMFVHWWYEPF